MSRRLHWTLREVTRSSNAHTPGAEPTVIRGPRREARVFRADGSVAVIGEDGVLDGEDVLPGFACPLRAILGR